MRVSLFYEFQTPRPWDEGSEKRKMFEAMEQIELADTLGFGTIWQVEHHFLEEYSHSSAPDLFLAALSQRTKNIRLGHGIANIMPRINHPARVAERISTLDLLSGGRVEFGTGESTTNLELGGFFQDRRTKTDTWREAISEIPRMMVETPYPGYQGEAFSMPQRNVIPKPQQKPHPPIWVACTKPSKAASIGHDAFGVLTFGVVTPETARDFVSAYYTALASDEARMRSYVVNPNVAFTSGFFCAKTEKEARIKGLPGLKWFAHSLLHVTLLGKHVPGRTSVTKDFHERAAELGLTPLDMPTGDISTSKKADIAATSSAAKLAELMGTSNPVRDFAQALEAGVGTPQQLRAYLNRWESAGADEVILIAQAGITKHEDILQSLELFGKEVLPEFLERDVVLQAEKQKRMAPVIERLMARGLPSRELVEIELPSDPTIYTGPLDRVSKTA